MERNFYKILGVEQNATAEEISKAYRKLVLQYHPDRIRDLEEKKRAEEKLKEITEAYNTLSNPRLRAEYDKTLYQPKQVEKSPEEKALEYFKQAMDFYGKGDYKGAESLLTFVYRLTPSDQKVKFYLGISKIYSPLSKVEGARLAEEALKADPYHPEWFIDYAKALLTFKQELRAKKVIEEGLKANPQSFILEEFYRENFKEKKGEQKEGGIFKGLFGKKS